MHTVNSRLLKKLMKESGEGALARASLETAVSISTLEKMLAGTYRSAPSRITREALCRYFKVPETDLFPLARKKAA